MRLLSVPFDESAAAPPRVLRAACLRAALVAGLLVAAGCGIEWRGGRLGPLGHGLASGAVHAGFIAVGWIIAVGGRPRWQGPVLRVGVGLVLASVMARLSPWGAVGFLLVPGVLLHEARGRHDLRAMGVSWPRASRALTGLGVGIFLGAHLLISASRTFGYAVYVEAHGSYLAALAYDAGANALSAEWLFRGAVFSHLWRRWAFWPAALLSTALVLLRYLVDPALPHAVEVRAGAVFYTGLLGLAGCALRAWSGSLLPGYLATLLFFAAYRTLAP